MEKLIIACENLKDEVNLILNELNINSSIIWIDSQLHNIPDKLRVKIQEEIDKAEDDRDILLLFGCCGGGTVGLKSKKNKLICPKVDDCFSLYLGGNEQRKDLYKSVYSYFFTKRYIEDELSLYHEIERVKEKYGDKKAKIIIDMMIGKYQFIRVIDTGAYNVNDILDKTTKLAKDWNMEHEILKGDLSILYKALEGNWDEDFIKINCEDSIEMLDFIV